MTVPRRRPGDRWCFGGCEGGGEQVAGSAYVRRLYRCDPADASLYHLVIDSTAIPLDTVTELILTAARAHEAPVSEQSEPH